MDGGAWWAAVQGVARSRTWLSDFTFTFHFPALEKEMATHSSVLAWRIPGTGEPGGLRSMGSHRVRHDWSDLAAAAAKINNLLKPDSKFLRNPLISKMVRERKKNVFTIYYLLNIILIITVNSFMGFLFYRLTPFYRLRKRDEAQKQ